MTTLVQVPAMQGVSIFPAQQQLGVQALSIANQNSQSILSLFK